MYDLLRECEAVCQKLDVKTIDSSLLEIIVDCTCILDTYPNLKTEDIYLISFIQLGLVMHFLLQDTSGLRFYQGVEKQVQNYDTLSLWGCPHFDNPVNILFSKLVMVQLVVNTTPTVTTP